MRGFFRSLTGTHRIALVGVVAIILPAALLGFFIFGLTKQMGEFLEESVRTQYEASAKLRAVEIERRIAKAEAKLRESLPGELRALTRLLPELNEKHRLVRAVYLYDEKFSLVYPPPEAHPESPENVEEVASNDPELREAERLEYEVKDLRKAVALYREIARKSSGEKRLAGLAGEAGCRFKLGQYDLAEELCSKLARQTTSPSLEIVARFQLLLSKLNLREDIKEELTSLWRRLLKGDVPYSRSQFLRRELRPYLERYCSGDVVGELLREERAYEEEVKFVREFRDWLVLRLQLDSNQLRGSTRFRHAVFIGSGGRVRVAGLTGLELSGKPHYLVVEVEPLWLRERVFEPVLREPPPGTSLVIMSRRDRVSPSTAGLVVAEEDLDELGGFWRVAVVETSPTARSLHRKLVVLYSVFTVLVFVLIIFGVYLTIRDAGREIELSRLKSDFVSRVSHELKTPIALIRMFAETLSLGRVKEEEKVREYYSIIMRESERLGLLVSNVLDFSRIEAGRKTYEYTPEDVAGVVEETVQHYRPQLESKGFEVEVEIEDGIPVCLIDRSAIAQCVVNLLSNAEKYSEERREVRVRVYRDDRTAIIEVVDKGIGMEISEVRRIFEKFYRGTDPRVLATRGTGLGLAIVKHCVEAHGGRVEVESRKGEGSTFRLRIPIREAHGDGEDSGNRG